MKDCVFYFKKRFIVYQNLGILSKKIKISKGCNSAEFIVILWHFTCVFPRTAYKKVLKECPDQHSVLIWMHIVTGNENLC